MKEFNSIQVFNYPWDYVSAANWRKYPNEQSKHVVGVDVLRRELKQGKLITERLITCKQPIPSWLQYMVGVEDRSYVREVSIIDPVSHTLTMRSVNLTMTSLLKVRETVIYKPDPMHPNSSTIFTQRAQIVSSYGWMSVRSKIEQWAAERFSQNASKGKLGFESVLELGWGDVVHDVIDKFTDKFIFEINHISNQIINEIDAQTTEIVNDLTTSTKNVINEIKESTVIHDINTTTFDLIKEMNDKTNLILSELNEKTHQVIQEVNQKTKTWVSECTENDDSRDVIIDIQDKTHNIVNEMNEKKNQVLNQMDSLTSTIFKALDERSLEIFDKKTETEMEHNETSFIDHLKALFKR